MEFRQDYLMHRDTFNLSLAMLLLWGILNLSGSFLSDFTYFNFFLLIILLIPLIWCARPGSRICIDENGIRCRTRRTVLWAYEWHEIRTLRCERLNRYPVITVVPFEPPKQDLQSPLLAPQLYFQANRHMKKQIKAICKCPIEE